MATYYTVTGNLGGFMPPGTNMASLVAVVTTNLGGPVVDTAGNRVALGDVDVPVQANGDISVSLLQTDSADTNVSGWSYWLNVGYRTAISKVGGRGVVRDVARLGPFPLTADSTLAELSVHFDTPAVDPTWRDGFRTEMETLRDEAAAISGLDDVEGAVILLDANPASPIRVQQDARLSATIGLGANLTRVLSRAKSGRPIKVAAIGDSVLEGTNVTSGGGVLGTDDALSLVASGIASRFGVTATKVNHALSGHTVAMGALSLKWNAAVTEQADLYLIAYGANDSAQQRFATPVRGYSPDAFAAGLERLFRRLRKDVPRADIAWLIYGQYNAASTAAENVALDKYATRAVEVCAAYGVEVIDARARFRAVDGIAPNAALYADSIHPNKAGHAALAAAVMEHLPTSRAGATPALAAVPTLGLYAPEKIGGGQDSGADFVLAPTAGKWVETGTWSTAGSARTSTTAGDKISGTFTGAELYVMLDTSTAADLHATLTIDGSPVYTNQPHDANPVGTSWMMLATGLTPGAHTWELALVSGTMTVSRVGWLASVAGAYNADTAHVVLASDTTLTQVPTSGSALTPLPSGSMYIDLPAGWATADVYLTGWLEYRITGSTATVRTVRTRLIVDGTDRRDIYVTSGPVGENTYLSPIAVDAVIVGMATHKLAALNITLTSADKTLTYLKAYRLEAKLIRRS